MPTFTKQQVNYFIMGWLLEHPNGSSTVVDRRWYENLDFIQNKVFAHIFDGQEIDASFTPLAESCAVDTVKVFGRVGIVIGKTTTAAPLPEIHHDHVPRSEDPWSSSFTPLT